MYQSKQVIKIKSATRLETFQMRFLIVLGLAVMGLFVWYFFGFVDAGDPFLYGLLTFALIFKLYRTLYEWYHYFDLKVPEKTETEKQYTVDILTTFCKGEPYEMITNTLKAIKAIEYPHETYLCDEADDPFLKSFCEANGIHHVTRTNKKNAKAGNINNALENFCKGELVVIMDPDHIPRPEFLDRVVAYFDDPKVGYVQVIQAYYNQEESLVANGAAQQTYHFYGPTMVCQGNYGTAQAIGANCTFRRRALDSIGGHAPGLAEDMHTAMRLHAKRWKSIYVPEVLSEGLVPSTLSAFYKQQLKWSRGCFELLFEVYPRLFTKFSFRQKLHYLFSPLYYLFGVVNMIDIFLPIFSLITTKVPWLTDVQTFALYYIPLLIIGLIIRLFAQRWVAVPGERGIHITGGLLRLGTWWIYVIGFIYSIFRVKVPYIPTPKEGEVKNEWEISLVNGAALLLSVGALVYGLLQDLNPYSTLMAGFAFTNSVLLVAVVLMGQQKWYYSLVKYFSGLRKSFLFSPIFQSKIQWTNLLHKTIQRTGLVWGVATFFLLVSFIFIKETNQKNLQQLKVVDNNRGNGDFMLGIYHGHNQNSEGLDEMANLSKAAKKKFNLFPIYLSWGPESIKKFPYQLIDSVYQAGAIPLITWEPWGGGREIFDTLGASYPLCRQITAGQYDNYLKDFAYIMQYLRRPVMIRFAQQPDNPVFPWSEEAGNSPEDFQNAWRYTVQYFIGLGVSNVAWIWQPWKPEAIGKYYPGDRYVDWVGVSCLNYGVMGEEGKWLNFENLYHAYHVKAKNLFKPVIITELGSTNLGGNQKDWLENTLLQIREYYHEVWALMLYQPENDRNWPKEWPRQDSIKTMPWKSADNGRLVSVFQSINNQAYFRQPGHPQFLSRYMAKKPSLKFSRCRNIQGEPGNYSLWVEDTAFYIKGIAYNTNDDWRNGNIPLSLHKLKTDIKAMKEMGANTIRRYGVSIYDENLLNVAADNQMKVMYGFWFEPDVDYLMDSAKVRIYIEQVENQVKKYKDHPAILTWGLGNETWGLMKHHFTQPYLTEVRLQYVKMLEYLANRIHQIDPIHPVITASEHSNELSCELIELKNYAPSVDIIGVNSYYLQQVSKLHRITQKVDPSRPYLFSEYGPLGYWDDDYNRYNEKKELVEDSDYEKAWLYGFEWKQHVLQNKGFNLGGVAFCWSDRLEGTATWFGLTDQKGRKKPAYFTLEHLYKGVPMPKDSMPEFYIQGPGIKIQPGKYFEFKVWSKNGVPDHYKYSWTFRREEYLDELPGLVRHFENGKRVMVKIPWEPSKYRLYLYVHEEDKVITHSFPIYIDYKKN
jgi:cellulose synthase (UDP-forming)